ncbi:MAG: hypothetical protein D6806_07310 [Deltaproteobacteria bacterium]|nr:MAG: hypothetical protein D6806_07310 [Deltaproteobacteria bacterium]
MAGADAAGKIGLIVNPKARAVRRRYYRRRRFWEGMLPPDAVRITGNDDELVDALRQFRKRGIRVLATLGGDGTMSHAYNCMKEIWPWNEYPYLLPLPAGTLNAVPKSLGLKGEPESLLARFLEIMRSRPEGPFSHRVRYPLAIEDHKLGKTILAFSFLSGFLFRSIEQYYSNPSPGPRDLWRAGVMPVIWTFWPSRAGKEYFEQVPARVIVDGRRYPADKINAVLLSTFDHLVLWYSPFPTSIDGQPCFHFIVNSMPRHELLRHLVSLVRGRYQGDGHWVGTARSVEIETEIGYVVDGEIYHRQTGLRYSVTVRSGPGLRFLLP